MSNEPVASSSPLSVHIPVALLGLAISMFLFVQIRQNGATSETLSANITTAEDNDKTLKDNEKRMKEMNAKNEPVMKQAKALFDEQQNFLNAVLELSKTNDNAKKVVAKNGIQKNQQTEDAAAATPAPAADKKP